MDSTFITNLIIKKPEKEQKRREEKAKRTDFFNIIYLISTFMKKKIIGLLLMGAFVASSTSVFVSCKDYDDDITDLKAQINSLDGTVKSQISKLDASLTALESAYKSGDDAMLAAARQAVAEAKSELEAALATKDQFNSLEVAVIKAQTDVDQALKLIDEKASKSDLNSMQGDIDDAKASLASIKDALSTATSNLTSVQSDLTAAVTRITTMENDVKTALKELTELTTALSGQQAALETVADGASAISQNILGLQARANELEDQMKVLAGLISVGGGTVDISEVTVELSRLRQTVLDLSEQIDPDINTLVVALSKALRSMVFKPYLYLDGIEAIEYPWIGDTILQKKIYTSYDDLSHHATVTGDRHDITNDLSDYIPNRLGRWYNNATGQIEQSFGTNNTKYHTDLTSVALADKEWIYGPAWEVDYHLNPSTASISYATNAPSFNVLESEVVYYNTRASESSLGITSPENFFVNNKAFTFPAAQFSKNAKGELAVGLQIAHPENLAPWPTDGTINPNGYPAGTGNANDVADNPNSWDNLADTDDYFGSWYCNQDNHKTYLGRYHYTANNKDNVIALQMHNATSTNEADMITSDYALLVPTRIQLEGLVWDKKPQYIEPKDEYFKGGPGNRKGDEEGWANLVNNSTGNSAGICVSSRVHVWDSPEEALADPDGAALELPCMDPNGVDLTQYLGIHYVKENLLSREYDNNRWQVKLFKYGEEAAFGLHYEFELMDYKASTNATGDSRYASFSDWADDGTVITNWNGSTSRTGRIIARNVDATVNNVKTLVAQSTTAVDREPLVRVMVKNDAGKVLLDGYILLHITYTPENLTVDNYPEYPMTFKGCNDETMMTYWNQFSNLILHEKLNMSEILNFDNRYWADCIESDVAGYQVITSDTMYVTHDGVYASTNKAFMTGVAADGHGRGYQLRLFNFGSDIYGKGKKDNDITAVDADGYGLPIERGSGDQYEENGNIFEQASTGTNRTTLGNAIYYPNGEGTTNHTFSWTLTPDELEYLTHDTNAQNNTVEKDGKQYVKVVRYFRFISKDKSGRDRGVDNYSAPYPYVWVKMTILIDRYQMPKLTYKEKIDNYWYNWNENGTLTTEQAYNGWSAWLIDIEAPRNGETRRDERWPAYLSNALIGNYANVSGATEIKYYFAPKPANGIQITAQNGVTYTITPKNDGTGRYQEPIAARNIPAPLAGGTKDYGNGSTWNKLFCKYVWGTRSYNNVYGGGSQFIPALRTIKPLNDSHVWSEDDLEATLQNCVIIYDDEVVNGSERNAGVFNDSLLYASYKVGSVDYYTPIARIIQQKQTASTTRQAGAIELIHWLPLGSTATTPGRVQNVVLYDVLNAMGYPMNADGTCKFDYAHEFINKQLRGWVGVVAKKDCNRAQYVEQEKYDDSNKATFLASWERPINLNLIPDTVALDANTNENYLYLLDYIKLFDWRGDYTHQGYMYDDENLIRNENHWWFWAYYNVKGIEVDLTSVYTNMHKDQRPANQEWVLLNSVTKQLSLYHVDPLTGYATTSSGRQIYGEGFEITKGTSYGNDWPANPAPNGWGLVNPNQFQSSDREADIENYMGLRPVDNVKKSLFGAIYYANNGLNVTEFDLVFPITIFYEWGYLQYKPVFENGQLKAGSALVWHIQTTHGR